MRELIERLYNKEDLSIKESQDIFLDIFKGEMDPILMTSVLIALRMKGETYKEISGAVKAILSEAALFPIIDYKVGDIVGTGGDKSDTINVSTLSTFVAATLGVKMTKHGNRSVSSKCGSFDLLEVLGVNFQKPASKLKSDLDELGVCFLYAPMFHTGFKNIMPVRQALKTKTIFNILGPLVNPARPSFQTVGVYAKELVSPMAQVLNELGLKKGLVVYGDGLDEISPCSETTAIEIRNGQLKNIILSPETFGFSPFSLDEIKGGDKEKNLEKSLLILNGKGTEGQRKMIAINTAPLLVMANKAKDYKQAASLAMDALGTSAPMDLTKKLADRK